MRMSGTTSERLFHKRGETPEMKTRTVVTALFAVLAVCLVAPAAFAQAPGGAAEPTNWVAITSGFAMAIASAFCGYAQAKGSGAASEGKARQPWGGRVIPKMFVL